MQNILTNTPLKITGVGTLSSYEKVMASQQVEREGFEGLRPRRFHVSRRGGQPFVTEAHGFLAGSKERMTTAEQAAFAERQLDRYYRSPHPQARGRPGRRGECNVVICRRNSRRHAPPNRLAGHSGRASPRKGRGGAGGRAAGARTDRRGRRAPPDRPQGIRWTMARGSADSCAESSVVICTRRRKLPGGNVRYTPPGEGVRRDAERKSRDFRDRRCFSRAASGGSRLPEPAARSRERAARAVLTHRRFLVNARAGRGPRGCCSGAARRSGRGRSFP